MPGTAKGEVLVTSQSISFWGGVDPATGAINDPRHELFGHSVTGKVLAFPFGKGSSTGSLIMLELIRVDKAPAAIVNIRTEPILATGPIVGHHFYGRQITIIFLKEDFFQHNLLRWFCKKISSTRTSKTVDCSISSENNN